jgi:hypothetical protein
VSETQEKPKDIQVKINQLFKVIRGIFDDFGKYETKFYRQEFNPDIRRSFILYYLILSYRNI